MPKAPGTAAAEVSADVIQQFRLQQEEDHDNIRALLQRADDTDRQMQRVADMLTRIDENQNRFATQIDRLLVRPAPAPTPPDVRPSPRRLELDEREHLPVVRDDADDDKSRYKMDKLPHINPMLFNKPNYVGMTTALKKHFDDIHDELRHFRRNDEFRSGEGRNQILNDLLLKSLPDLLLNPLKRRYDSFHELLQLSYKDVKLQLFNISARLEFGSDLVTYLEANAQPPDQPLATYHAFLEGMLEAYPEELSSMSVVMAAFRAHQLPLRNAYFDRFPPPPDERTPMTVPRLLQRMAELERATQFRDDQNRRAQGAAIQQANNAYHPASAYVVQQAPLPLAPATVGPPPAAAFVVQPSGPPAEEWTPDKARAVYVNAFERKEEEAFGRSKGSPVPYENEIMSVYIVTADLNKEHMEPQDDNQIDQVLNAMRLIVAQARMSCPGFDRQLAQLLRNKERSVEMSRQRLCWNCGQPGHMRSQCPQPRRRFAPDYSK